MASYTKPERGNWAGRESGRKLYLHEHVELVEMDQPLPGGSPATVGLLGYCCDEGVQRNQGRPGAANGPGLIRQQLGKLPSHLQEQQHLWDLGDIYCEDGDMESAQDLLASKVSEMINKDIFPLLMGGGHDISYAHYRGLRNTMGNETRLGIINLDAHLDLREPNPKTNSGTPFFQIAGDARKEGFEFHYMCMGVRSDANDAELMRRAQELNVALVPRQSFVPWKKKSVRRQLQAFLDQVDQVYLTIDMDGFASAYAPGVSAASPMGFCPDMAMWVLKHLVSSGKLLAADVAEFNPEYDRDGQTAKLAASLIHRIVHSVSLR